MDALVVIVKSPPSEIRLIVECPIVSTHYFAESLSKCVINWDFSVLAYMKRKMGH